MSSKPSPSLPHSPSPAGNDFADWMMRTRLVEIQAEFSSPPTPSVNLPPAPTGRQMVAFSQPPEFSNPAEGFQGGPIPQAHSSSRVSQDDATPHTIDPCKVPLGVKPVAKWSLSGDVELSMFDILNIFHWWWFLSISHLRAQALSAQKAEDRKIFWVEFTPLFHTHLVKCAVAPVPHPIQKVEKVMFMYILELLKGESHQAFFNLTKGTRIATQAQKKRQLSWKRNCTLR
jgi:hypothetical protein